MLRQNTVPISDIEALGLLIDQINKHSFAEYFSTICQQLSYYDSTVIMAFSKDHRPRHIFDNLNKVTRQTSLEPYLNGAYLLDPFYHLYINNRASGLYRLRDLAPDEFFISEYYQTYYASTKLSDEAGLLITLNSDYQILISFGLRDPSKLKIKGQFKKLQSLSSALVAICTKHWQTLPLEQTFHKDTLGFSLDLAFKNFGDSVLTNREKEVVHLILKGHSSKSLARDLSISADTVKVHRKRAHAKLGTTSQAELFSLFLESLSLVTMGSDSDPLQCYFQSHPDKKPTL